MIIIIMMSIMFMILPLLLSIMLNTLLESKLQGYIQHSIGPNMIGLYGMFQPMVDGLKLLMKDMLIPQKSVMMMFCLSPLLSLMLSLCLWFSMMLLDSYLGMLMLLAMGGLEIYGLLLGGWSSQNKYTLIGSIRTTSQLVSYELMLGMIYYLLSLSIGSFSLYYFNMLPLKNLMMFLPMYLISLMIILAETNSAPFDLPESESETVGGFMTEHSAIIFAFYFLAEYSNMIFLSYIMSLFFTSTLILLPFHFFFFMHISATVPSLRYDHLIKLCWYQILPIMMGYLILYLSILNFFYF